MSTMVEIRTPDGTADAYLAHPDDGAPHPAVLLYMDAFGLRPHLRGMADRLASAGYTVLVPNVFYRSGRAPLVELPDFIDPAERPEIIASLRPAALSLTLEGAMRDAAGYLDWLAASPLTTDGKAGVTGYCMGAGLALRTAGTHPDRIAAAAGFHGAFLATDAPDSPHLLADRITPSCTSGTRTRTPPTPPTRSPASTRPSPRPGSATAPRSTPAPTTASPRPTRRCTAPRRRTAIGRHCWSSWGARSDPDLMMCRARGIYR